MVGTKKGKGERTGENLFLYPKKECRRFEERCLIDGGARSVVEKTRGGLRRAAEALEKRGGSAFYAKLPLLSPPTKGAPARCQ